jgi:uncharacterized protein DUF1214
MPPVTEFWEIPLYDREGYFYDNPIDRYSINSYVLKRGKLHTADGKLVIYVQNDEPKDADQRQNWLPAPKGASSLLPASMALERHWLMAVMTCPGWCVRNSAVAVVAPCSDWGARLVIVPSKEPGSGPTAIDNIDHGRTWPMRVAMVLGLCVSGYLALAYLTGRINYPAIAQTLTRGLDGERDDQEEAVRLEGHPSFAAVLGRRCLVLSGDRYLCILRRSLLAAKRPMIG